MYSKNNQFIKDYQEVDKNVEETRLYFLILGCMFPFTEIFIELFKIRLESELVSNIIVGATFLLAYFLSKKNKFIRSHINRIFNIIYLVVVAFVVFKIIVKPFELLTYSEFLIIIFFSYGVFRNLNYFFAFNICLLVVFVGLFAIKHFEFNLGIIYLNSIITVALLSYTRHIAIRQSNQKLIFSNSIVHKGNSLVIARNNVGEVLFCSNNIKDILGYHPDDVMGMGFWLLTEDKDFEVVDYTEKYQANQVYTRKLKCKNGDYKFIQWQDNKYSNNLYVGIGQDVTEKLRIQNEYLNLIQTANDIIYKADNKGNFSFVNDYGKQLLGLGDKDLIGKHFTSLIRNDYVKQISAFYIRNSKNTNNYTTQEFPIVLKNNRIMWVSQNVTIERDLNNKILGFSAIVRDITDIKHAEHEKIKRQQKSQTYTNLIKELTLKTYSTSHTFTQILDDILKRSSDALGADRGSIWNYRNKSINCINSISNIQKNYQKGDVLLETELPSFFNAFTQGIHIVANNIRENVHTKELCADVKNDIRSLLDIPVFSNAELNGLVCFETVNSYRTWDDEDVSFARAIADIMSVTYETQRRKKAEQQLIFRGEILAAIAKATENLLISQDIQTTLSDTLKIIGTATRVDELSYYKLNANKNQLELKSNWLSENYHLPNTGANLNTLPLHAIGSMGKQLLAEEPFVCILRKSNENEIKDLFAKQNILSTLALPLFIKNKLHGCIVFNDCKIEKKWSDDQLMILNSLITNITNAIERINNENIIKDSEANFRLLNETIDNVFWLYDLLNKNIIYISSSSSKILGVDPEEFYRTNNYWENYIFDEDKPLILKAHEKVEKDGFYEIEYRIRTKDGIVKWIYEKSFGIKNEAGIFAKSSGMCSDITLKKQTELALVESENNFRQINETIQDVFWLYDIKNRKYLYISSNSEDIFGIPDWEFYQGIHMKRNFVVEEDLEVFKTAESWLLKQDAYEIEYRIIKGNAIRWINEKSFAIRNEHGELIRNSGICRDITKQKDSEKEIRQLSLVAQKTTNGILIADSEGRTIWANQSYLDMFEISLKELVGKRPRDLFIEKKHDALIKQIEVDNGNNFSREFEVVTHVSKKKLWIELNSTVIKDEGESLIQQIEVITDITEKIRVKNELKRYSRELEFQNTLKEKLINAANIEEITTETLGFIKENIRNCVRISLLSIDEKKQNLYGYLFNGTITEKVNYSTKEFKSFETVKNGGIFIERDLSNTTQRSVSDETILKTNTRSYIILPIIATNGLIGTLNVGFDFLFELSDSEINNLQNFTSLLSVALEQLNLKNALLEKDKDNIGSLMYAKNIQNTILPNIKTTISILKDVCLLFKPRDIVSGDFYWAKETPNHAFIAVADCTGHGVPGSFLTLIGSKILDQIITVENVISPAEILTKLDENLYNSLNVKKDSLVRDGMEIAFCTIDKRSGTLIFSGSGLGLIYFKDQQEFYIRGQVKSIGDYRQDSAPFENVDIQLTGNEVFFMATDGYQDQLGGEKYKRLSKKKTIEILNSLQNLPPEEQENKLKKEIRNHIGDYPQTDDITVLGFKINTINKA